MLVYDHSSAMVQLEKKRKGWIDLKKYRCYTTNILWGKG